MATEVQPYLTAAEFVKAVRDCELVKAKRPSLRLHDGHYCLLVTDSGDLVIKHNDELVAVIAADELWTMVAWVYSVFAPRLNEHVARELDKLIVRKT